MAELKQVPEAVVPNDRARQIIYIVLAAGLGIAGVLGFIDPANTQMILDNIVQIAGALGFGLAAANKPKPVTYAQSRPVASERTDSVGPVTGKGHDRPSPKPTPTPDNPAPNTRDVDGW